MQQKKQLKNAKADNKALRKQIVHGTILKVKKVRSTLNQRTLKHQAQGPAVDTNKTKGEKVRGEASGLKQMPNRKRNNCQAKKKERTFLRRKLDIAKKNLAKEKALKETFMNRCRELEGLLKTTTAEIPPLQSANTNRQKGKRARHGNEGMEVDSSPSEENISAELKAEREKNRLLQEDLNKIRGAHQELGVHYQNDIHSARIQVDTLQNQLQAYADKVSQDQATMAAMTKEHHALLQKAEEASKKYQADMLSAGQTVDTLQKQLQAHAGRVSQDQATMASMREQQKALHQKMAEESQNYQANIQHAGQVVETLQRELQKQMCSQADSVSQDQSTIMSLKVQHQATCQKMTQEMSALKQYAISREQLLLGDIDKLNTQLKAQNNIQKELKELQARANAGVEAVRATILEERNKTSTVQREMEMYKSAHLRLTQKYMLLLKNSNPCGVNPGTS